MAHEDFVVYSCSICGLEKLPGPYCPDCKSEKGMRERIAVYPSIAPVLSPRQYSEEELEQFKKDFAVPPMNASALIRAYLQKNIKPGNGVPCVVIVHQFWDGGKLKIFASYRHTAVRVRNVVAQMGWKTYALGGRTFFERPKDDLKGYDPTTKDAI